MNLRLDSLESGDLDGCGGRKGVDLEARRRRDVDRKEEEQRGKTKPFCVF